MYKLYPHTVDAYIKPWGKKTIDHQHQTNGTVKSFQNSRNNGTLWFYLYSRGLTIQYQLKPDPPTKKHLEHTFKASIKTPIEL